MPAYARSFRASRALVACAVALVVTAAGCSDDPSIDASISDASGVDVDTEATLDSGSEADAEAPDTAADSAPDVPADASAHDAPDTESDAPADDDADAPGLPDCVEAGCPEGFQCYSTGCLPVIAAGDPCSQPDDPQCEQGAFCTDTPDGERCVLHGTPYGRCRGSGGPRPSYECRPYPICDEGLTCDTSGFSAGRCLPGLDAGEFCVGYHGNCNSGTSCSQMLGTGLCIADGVLGGRCRPTYDGAEDVAELCDADLTCVRTNDDCVRGSDRCYIVVGAAESCERPGVVCDEGLECVRGPLGAVCAAAGELGALCRDDAPACDAGTECLFGELGSDARCRRPLESADACGGSGSTTVCPDGEACSSVHMVDAGVCAAAGTAPGADCRETEPHCDGALVCSDFSRYRRSCRVIVETGDRCDLSHNGLLCPDGDRCLAMERADDGTIDAICTAPVPEQEPNDRATVTGGGGPTPALYAGEWSADDAEDCYSAALDAVGSLLIEVATNAPGVSASLYDPSAVEIGRWPLDPRRFAGGPLAGSARLEPSEVPLLRGLAPGEYVVCVRNPGEAWAYTLAFSALPSP